MRVDAEKLLNELDIDIIRGSTDEVRGACPMHAINKPEKRGSVGDWTINTETGIHFCFSCGYAGTTVSLVQDLLGVMRWDALTWLVDRNIVGVLDLEVDYDFDGENEAAIEISEAHLSLYDEPPKTMLQARRMSKDSARIYGVLWDPKEEEWILPIRTRDGALMGWQRKGQNSSRALNVPDNVEKSKTLFGIDIFERGTRAILVESPLDCARIWTAGYDGAVSSFGVFVSSAQLSLVRQLTDKLMIALDDDEAGWKVAQRAADKWRFRFDLLFMNYPGGVKDPGDMTNAQVAEAIEEAERFPNIPRYIRDQHSDRAKRRRRQHRKQQRR